MVCVHYGGAKNVSINKLLRNVGDCCHPPFGHIHYGQWEKILIEWDECYDHGL